VCHLLLGFEGSQLGDGFIFIQTTRDVGSCGLFPTSVRLDMRPWNPTIKVLQTIKIFLSCETNLFRLYSYSLDSAVCITNYRTCCKGLVRGICGVLRRTEMFSAG
jgi:hypothetical protein